jgi:hypothetical protein
MKNFLAVILVLLSSTAFCQFDYQEDGAVRAVINKMFKGMQTGDTILVRSCFDPSARMQTATIDATTGVTQLQVQPIDSFLTQIARIREQQLPVDEKLLTCEIKTDVPMATAWAPYDFYVNGVKSHSGVNAFQLFKSSTGWKIIQICDTRRK